MKIIFSLFILSFIIGMGCAPDPDNNNNTPPSGTGAHDWTRQFIDVNSNLNDIFFFGSSSGWVVGDNQTVLSTGSGESWPLAPAPSPVENLKGVFLLSEQEGWMVGDLDSDKGQIHFSGVGGSYPEQKYISDHPLNTVFFIDDQTGYAAGENGILSLTTDAGQSWDDIFIADNNEILDLYFLDNSTGWAGTGKGIYHTSDGINWQKENIDTAVAFHGIHFIDTLNGWACGSNNTILRRVVENNEVTWLSERIENEVAGIVWRDIFFIGKNNGWVVGDDGIVYKTSDGGASWIKEISSSTADLNAIYMVNSSKGWIVGNEGVVMTYTPRE